MAERKGLEPLGRLVAYAHAGVEPKYMGIGPVPAVRLVLEKAGLKVDDIDVFEVNEAFAAQALAVVRDLSLPEDRTNPNGSGISLGHPIGATGCILTVKALYELKRTGGRGRWSRCASAAARASRRSSSAPREHQIDGEAHEGERDRGRPTLGVSPGPYFSWT